MTFSEISSKLDAALSGVQAKKDAYYKAQQEATKTNEEYQKSLEEATLLRDQLSLELEKLIPSKTGRVRAA